MIEECVGDAEIAFCIFKINRIDLVRHRARSDLSFFHLLHYPAVRNVAPHVLREIDEDRIDTTHVVEELRVGVMRLNLRRHWIELEAHVVLLVLAFNIESLDKLLRKPRPINFRLCDDMRIVIASRPTKFDENGTYFELVDLATQPLEKNFHLFSECCRGGRLPMRTGEHRRCCMLFDCEPEIADYFFKLW